MPGPAPKPDAIRRNAPTIEWTDLPRSGNSDPVPTVPWGWEFGEYGLTYWFRAWKSPESTQWGEPEKELVARLCQLHELWNRSIQHAGKTFENEYNGRITVLEPDTKLLPEMRQLEAALGRTAKARKELRWRIAESDHEVEDRPAPVSEEGRRRLKVVG